MKLINPTLGELDAAFAEKVAGWVEFKAPMFNGAPSMPYTHFDQSGRPRVGADPFTRSMDAVVPWLEKMPSFEIVALAYSVLGERYECQVWPTLSQSTGANNVFLGRANMAATAAVIALLRAHGVEVEFTE